MRGRWYRLVSGLLLVGMLIPSGQSLPPAGASTAPSGVAGPVLVEATPLHVVLEWTAPPYQVTASTGDGQVFQQVIIPGCPPAGRPGEPELPACTVTLGVPPDAELAVRVVEQETVPLAGVYSLPPVAEPAVEENLAPEGPITVKVVGERRVAGPAYTQEGPFPPEPAALGEPAFLRHQRLVAIHFFPVQYSPRSGELTYHPRVRLEIAFSGATGPMGYVAEPADFERLLERTLLNYPQARTWRRTATQPVDLPPVPPDPGYRIPVRQDGVYRLTYLQLWAAGLPVDTLDPRTFRLFRYGQEVSIRVVGEEDGRFDPADEVLFYGQALHGNRYSDAEMYWLTYGEEYGRRMPQRDGTPSGLAPAMSFSVTEHLEENHVYYSQMPWRPDHDHWFWNTLFAYAGGVQQSYAFPPHALAEEPYTSTLRIHMYSFTSDNSVNPDHHIRIFLNDFLLQDLWWDGQGEMTPTMSFPSSLLQPSGNIVRIECPFDTGAFAEFTVQDWLELDKRRVFCAEEDRLSWSGPSGSQEYRLTDVSQPSVLLLDTSDPDHPSEIVSATVSPAGPTYTVRFADTVTRTTDYLAVAVPQVWSPEAISATILPNLRDPDNGADYLVITHRDFYTQAQALADFRASQGLRVRVLDVADLYNLFAYGRQDAAAVYNFLAYAFYNWTAPAPAYVVLLGDGTYDPKNHISSTKRNFVLPYLGWVDPWIGETAADNRYVCLSGGDTLPDMHLGRLPANTPAEAQVMVNKIVGYESSPPPGEWRGRSLFVADDNDYAGNFSGLSDDVIERFYPAPYLTQTVYLSVTCPYQWPATICRDAIFSAINAGQLLVHYIGHGGSGAWASERLLYYSDLPFLSNGPYLPVALPMTCNEGYYVYPYADPMYNALAEEFLRADGKGWAASWSPTGNGVATGHHYLDEGFFDAVFYDDERMLGPATLAGKVHLWSSGVALDLLDTYLLLGDPALEMPLLETDLALDKATGAGTPLQPGDPLTFTVALTNAGPATAHHVVLTDTLSPYIVSPTIAAVGITLSERPGEPYVWDVADLVAGQSGTVTITARVSLDAHTGVLANQARVATSAQETDLQNNADLVTWLVIPGPPYQIDASANPPVLPADGASLSVIQAWVRDTAGNPVDDGTMVYFNTDAGTFFDGSTYYTTTTSQGGAEALLRASTQVVTATICVTSGQAIAAVAVPFVPLAPYSVSLQAEPAIIPLTGTAAITATVQDVFGHMVGDGTPVTFSTSLGAVTPTVTTTYGGLAVTTLYGTYHSGWATVLGRSGSAAGVTIVRIGTGGDYTLTLALEPPSLPADGQSQAVVTATLERIDGYPVTGTHWISFSTTLGAIPSRSLAISGTAAVTLTAATEPGTAVVLAWAEDASAHAEVVMAPGEPASLNLVANPTSLPVGGAVSLLVSTVLDPWGHPVVDGTPVLFSTDLGNITPTVGATQGGAAQAALSSGTLAGVATVLARAGTASDTAAVLFLALDPATLTLTVEPATLYADGVASATVSAWVGDRFGNPVQDGTAAQFYTDLGTVVPTRTVTLQGWATATLTSTAVGTATVQCFSGGIQAQQAARCIPGQAATILVTATPARLYANGVSTSTVTVYLWDAAGHPVVDGTVVSLGTTLGAITPTAALTWQGGVGAMLRSSRDAGWATVWAASGPARGQTAVEFFAYKIYLPVIARGGL